MTNFFLTIDQRLLINKITRLIAFFICVLILHKKDLTLRQILTITIIGWLGSEITYITEFYFASGGNLFKENFIKIGGRLSGLILLGFVSCLVLKINGEKLFYIILVLIFGVFVIGKWGCFILGDSCYGIPTTSVLGFKIYGITPSHFYVHPVPIYDSLFGLVLIISSFILRQKFQLNYTLQSYLTLGGLSVYLFFIEYLRINPQVLFGLTINQIVYLLLLSILFVLILLYKKAT